MRRSLAGVSIISVAFAAGCASACPADRTVFFQIQLGGDTGMAIRLAEGLHARLIKDPCFAEGTAQPSMRIYVPNLTAVASGSPTVASYKVTFSDARGEVIGEAKGTCREDALQLCVSDIAARAKALAARIRTP